ncbi:MAG: chromosome segregation protein SMC [Spirochaetes bacterium]|nr:MAG: chromosome segregation protein SMC [Spirochaetota bacterium]
MTSCLLPGALGIMRFTGGKLFLKRIEILGFKSFADRTVIEFNEGISALLGPNGCGKSNIVDAIKWVLGEQSVRNMRAERMDDVIFSGTESRKALNVAEVTLVIANDQGILEIERPEIAIKRRIFREGDSEYFLNGASVRLKEIRELFFDTGIGKSAYSVMEQGRIDQVLSNKPEERRYIFEEAAGITKYRMRGGEAERKLVRTEENMVQVENILHEVHRNYETLKKQTDKTLEYRKFKESVFSLDRDLKLLQWRDLVKSGEKKSDRLKSREDKYRQVVEKINEIKTALATELDSVNEMESRLIESQKQLYGMDLEKENQEEQVKNIRERRNESDETCKSARTREKNAVVSLGSLNKLKKNRETDLAAFKDRIKEIEGNISSLGKTISAAEERVNGNADETLRTNNSLTGEEQTREALGDDLRSLTDDIVRELDRGLKDSGYDRSARRLLAQSILDSLGELHIRSEGRARLLSDQKNLSDVKKTPELLSSAYEDFLNISKSLTEVLGLFMEYRDSEADFLEEFLAPEGIITRKRDLDEKITASAEKTRKLKEHLGSLYDEKTVLTLQITESRASLEELRVAQARTTTQSAAAEDSLASLAREAESEETRLDEIRQQLAGEEARIRSLDEQVAAILLKREELEKTQDKLRKDMAGLESGISLENEKMTGRESNLKKLTVQRGTLEIEKERIRLEMEHIENEIKLLLEDFRDRNSRDLNDYSDLRDSIRLSPKQIREKLSSSRSELKGLGQVNLMAPEEFKEVAERHDFLSNQLEDLKKAREHLSLVTEEIRKESASLFLKTFKEIREHFHDMFRRLFGGGRAEIRLVNPDDPLNSGLEIYAQPPGKKLENISLLSGGEKSLCGVALMFATFQVKPSPFCILDEIDAALDEANIQRFVSLLAEFGAKSQFVVITHNKKTVSGAKTLLGVTMQESGVSRLITMRLDEQEQGNEEPFKAD